MEQEVTLVDSANIDKKIIFVNHSLANNFSDRIEMNVYLKDYPELYNAILQHELQHTDKAFSKKDFLLDLTGNLAGAKINYWQLLKFMCGHPRSFMQLSPIIIRKTNGVKKIIFDINQIIVYLFLFGVIGLGIYIAYHV